MGVTPIALLDVVSTAIHGGAAANVRHGSMGLKVPEHFEQYWQQ